PCLGDLPQMRLPLGHTLLEECHHLAAQLVRWLRAGLLDFLQSLELEEFVVGTHLNFSRSASGSDHCKLTGMITYRKSGPPFSNPGLFGAVSSSVISSLSTTRSASIR